jgi:biopolymer transport protein ExbD/biopolymer transport protein TolR
MRSKPCLLILTLSSCLAPSVAQQPGRTAAPLRQGISVNLPVTRNATPVPDADNQDSLIVAVTRDGGVYLGLHRMTESALTAAVRVGLSNQAGKQLYIKVDARTSYANVGKVLDAVRAAQVDSVILLTSQSSPAQADGRVAPQGLKVLLNGPEFQFIRLIFRKPSIIKHQLN